MKVPVVFAVLVVGCAHHRAVVPELRSALVLHAKIDHLRVGVASPIAFTLRNTSASSLEFCLVDSGVSLWVRSVDGQMRPVSMYGATSGGGCFRKVRLAPGEGTAFQQEASVPVGWAPAATTAIVEALVRVKWPSEVRYTPEGEGTIRTSEFSVPLFP